MPHEITAGFTLDTLPDDAILYMVAVERALPGGGARVDRYAVGKDGSLTDWHYCRPPHERDTTINSPATWTCPHPGCGEVWTLQVRTWYGTPNIERDNATAYDY